MIIKPNEEKTINFQIENYKLQEYNDEYTVDGSTESNRKFHFFKFFIKAHFYKPELKWTKNTIHFHISRKEVFKKEVVGLRNNTPLTTTVKLVVEGNYVILNNARDETVKKHTITIPPSSTELVNILVTFEETAVQYETKEDEIFDGKINCIANGKDRQHPLILQTHVMFPSIKPKKEKYIFFMPNVPLSDHIVIENLTDMKASYEIKKLDEIEFIHNQVISSFSDYWVYPNFYKTQVNINAFHIPQGL